MARAAQEAGIAGLEFLRGIPGAIGGALRMNGGAYGRETKDVLIEARGVDRQGSVRMLQQCRHALHLSPLRRARGHHLHPGAVPGAARRSGRAIAAEMDKITESREATQPIKSRTGGSTFKNPPGDKAWQLIDAAGCRGLDRRRRAGVGAALQFPDQSRRRDRGRHRDSWRDRAKAREGQFRRRARMGDQADRRPGRASSAKSVTAIRRFRSAIA